MFVCEQPRVGEHKGRTGADLLAEVVEGRGVGGGADRCVGEREQRTDPSHGEEHSRCSGSEPPLGMKVAHIATKSPIRLAQQR